MLVAIDDWCHVGLLSADVKEEDIKITVSTNTVDGDSLKTTTTTTTTTTTSSPIVSLNKEEEETRLTELRKLLKRMQAILPKSGDIQQRHHGRDLSLKKLPEVIEKMRILLEQQDSKQMGSRWHSDHNKRLPENLPEVYRQFSANF